MEEDRVKEGKNDEKPSPLDFRVAMKETKDFQSESVSFFKINRRTLPLKLTLFLYYGAMSAILPYLTIHMKDIGISLSQIAIIYAVLPFTAFMGPPIMGFLADKFGQYKSVLVAATIINGVFHTLLLTVPKYSETAVYAHAVIEFQNSNDGGITLLRPFPADPAHCESFYRSLIHSSKKGKDPFQNKIINVFNCSSNANEDENTPVLNAGIFSRGFKGTGNDSSVAVKFPELCQMETSFTSEPVDEDDYKYYDNDSDGETNIKIDGLFCHFAIPNFPDNNGSKREIDSGNMLRKKRSTTSKSICSLNVKINSGNVPTSYKSFTCQTNYTFPTKDKSINGNGALTFWLYFLIRIIANLFMIACFSLLDATTLAIVGRNEGAQYGRERILCTIGFAAVSPVAGFIVDLISTSKGYTDYSAAFYLSNALLLFNVIGYFFMNLEVEKPEVDIWKNATDLLNYPEVVVFLGMIFIMGNMWGFVESYLFIFLDELKAPKYLLGLTLTVGSLAGIPFLYGAGEMVAKAGRVNIIVLAFVVYFIRFFGYSFIPNPFWCFPFEAMEAFTYHLMWVAAATYCAVLAPKGLLATLTGVMGSLHYGLGKGSGAFIGGYVINVTNTRLSFRYFGIFAGITGVVYFLINKFWLEGAIRKRKEREEALSQKEKKQSEALIASNETQSA